MIRATQPAVVKRSHRCRFYPSPEQQRALAQWFGHARFAWNFGLAARSEAWRERQETVGTNALSARLTEMKREPATAWLAAVPACVPAQALRNLDTAFDNFFAHRAKYPRFKAKHRAKASARVDFDHRHRGKVEAWQQREMVLPRLGRCKLAGRALPASMPKLVTVSQDRAQRYWVSFTVEEAPRAAPEPVRASVGVDAGARRLATLSSSETIDHPRAFQRQLDALRPLQRRMARQCKGSARRARTRQRLARVHARIADCRREQLHRVSTRIVHESQVIGIETLAVKEMTASAKGTVENPGTGVTRQSRINRALLDASMSELLRQIRYKAQWYGRTVVMAPQEFLSSQMCSACGFVEAGLRLDEYTWTCGDCGACHDRDVNAAKNLEAYALRTLDIHPEDTGGVRASGEREAGSKGTPNPRAPSANVTPA